MTWCRLGLIAALMGASVLLAPSCASNPTPHPGQSDVGATPQPTPGGGGGGGDDPTNPSGSLDSEAGEPAMGEAGDAHSARDSLSGDTMEGDAPGPDAAPGDLGS